MALRVLGSVAFDGEQLSPRERTVLAALAIAGPHGTSASSIADAVWGDDPPGTWPKQLQASIGIIRRSIGAASILTTPTGYALAAGGESADAANFERLVATARGHAAADDPERAVAAYRRALDLWRGSAYAELAEWPPAAAEIARLEEIRHTSEEELLQSRLACGDHRAVIADAERLVRENPYREERWCLLAVASYQSGRQAEALAALRTARRTLDDDLGIDPGERLTELETAILRQDPLLAPARHTLRISEDCPYRGLHAYGPSDADQFFGRDTEIEVVVDRLTRRRFLALAGASGSGKSSLALAGVVPILRDRGWTVAFARPDPDSLRSAPEPHEHHLLVIDQFEELFGLGLSEAELDHHGELLEERIRSGGALLLTVRSDYLDRCVAVPAFARLVAEGIYVVGPMSKDDLRIAIEGPAAQAGLRLESGLTELVLRDAQGATSALPLLSHALVETWLRREGSVLTVAGYEASGGIGGAIAQSADDLYASLSPEERVICRSTMLRLVSRAPDGTAVRRRVSSGPLVEDRERRDVLARLTRARLITAQDDSIVVAHEAIASAWPRLRRWLEEDSESSRMTEQLTAATEQWVEAGMPDSDLYRGARLAAVQEWNEKARPRLTAEETAFVDASTHAAWAEQRAADERAARDRQRNRRLRVALASVAVLLVASLAATGVAVAGGAAAARSAEAARAAETDASIEALLGTSLTLRDSSRDVSALLAAEMWQRWPDDPRSRAALMGVFTASGGLVSTSYLDSEWISGELIPGTDAMLLTRAAAALEVRDITTGAVSAMYAPPSDDVDLTQYLAISADGTTAAVAVLTTRASDDQAWSIEFFDARTLRPTGTPVAIDGRPSDIAITADGAQAALVTRDGVVVVADVATGLARRSSARDLPQPELTMPASLTFTPAGLLALGTVHPELVLLDPSDPSTPVTRIPIPAFAANTDSVVTASGLLIAAGERSRVGIDLATQSLVWEQTLETSKPTACMFLEGSSASGRGYCSDSFGSTVEFDIENGFPTGRRFDSQLGWPSSLSLSGAGSTLVTTALNSPAISVFRTDGGGAVTRLAADGHAMMDVFNATGDALVIARRPPTARYDRDLVDFAVWQPSTDAMTALPSRLEGAGWASATTLVAFDTRAEQVVFVDATTGEPVDADPVPEGGSRTWVGAGGARTYVGVDGDAGGYFATYDGKTGERLEPTFDLEGGHPAWISTNSDGSVVAITRWTESGAITGVFDGATGEAVVDGLEGPWITAITPDGTQLIAAEEGRITRHRIDTLEQIGTIPGARGEVNTLQMDAAGTTLFATANDETVSLYDLATGLRLGDPVPASAPQIYAGALDPDGRQFVVNVRNGIQVWDFEPEHQFEAACRVAGRELTDEEWSTYLSWLPDRRPTCAAAID